MNKDKDWYMDSNGMWVHVVVEDKTLYVNGERQDDSKTRDEVFRERGIMTAREAWDRGLWP